MSFSLQNNSCHCAIQFHIENWSDDGVILHPHTILDVIENVVKVKRKSGEGPVVVHCRYPYTQGIHIHKYNPHKHSTHPKTHMHNDTIHHINNILLPFSDTVSRSGIYCVVSNAIEQCKAEGVVDVFQATKAVRLHKPGAVTTLVSIREYVMYVERLNLIDLLIVSS